ncbi:MAG TPA: hypothetical protein EYN91_13025 [Candidatus Melainabacteria bacterium]|nr:hypothetical protein [Candidatus Melainabacteria bacterium]HIN64783.1 hypothetical protein [Candidatus Obscuribacterales bacterium]
MHDALLPREFTDAPTLVGRICGECNTNNFGNTIDRELTRSGYEGFQRYKAGIKPTSKLNELKQGGLGFGVQPPGMDEYIPANVIHKDDQGILTTKIEPFLLVYSRRQGKKIQIKLSDISTINSLAQKEDLDLEQFTFGTNGSEADDQKLISALKAQGIDILASISETQPSALLITEYAPSSEMIRALAKIAFNYFALICEKTEPSVPLMSDFDEIREFIKSGTEPAGVFFIMQGAGLLRGNVGDHSAVLKYSDDSSAPAVIVQVSIFNCFTYSFVLSRQPRSANFPEPQAHKWDLKKKRFGRIPLNLLIPTSER